MWGAELGGVLLVSPRQEAGDWLLLVAGLALGLMIRSATGGRRSPLFAAASVGACLWSTSRDFAIPFDALLLAALPVAVLKWRRDPLGDFIHCVIFALELVFSSHAITAPIDTWVAPLLAALCVATGKHAWFRVVFVLLRHMFPRAVRVAYGAVLVSLEPPSVPWYDGLMGPGLAYLGFALLASQDWYPAALAVLGFVSLALCI